MRKFKNLDSTIFADETGKIQSNAFDILNHTWNNKNKRYGNRKVFRRGIDILVRHFEMMDNVNYSYSQVVEHLEELTKVYYEILNLRKKIDMKHKLASIKDDF